ncbi:MAG: DUF501 domain-containing protein [Actinomycetota bacterium]
MELEHSDDDRAVVEAQLRRPVRGRWAVAARCHLGVPMVIESHPRLDDGSPFPTLFWLTCPVLVRRVSGLEATGRMAELTERLADDDSLRRRLQAALDRYATRRDAHEPIGVSGAPPGGGPEKVKCLHAHLAHQLADPPNPIGATTLAQTGWPDCRVACYSVPTREADA